MRLRFCYEAGPCGYGIQRQLTAAGHECVVVAPSLIPRRPGDRIKTDRRDATNLAKLHRAGELTAVWVPDARPTRRCAIWCVRGSAAVRSLRQARQQLSGFLLRQGCHYNRPAWTQAASALAGGSQVRAGGASHRAGRLHRGRRGGDGTARPAEGADRGGAAGLVAGTGGGSAAGAARHGAGQCGDTGGRTGRHHALRQSTPAHGLSRAGAVRAFQRRAASNAAASPRPATERRAGC